MPDPFNLARFVAAQEPVYQKALGELRRGEKRSHWMWFVFPQLAGLGSSEMARRYAISGREEAVAYLEHPVLGPRLRECTEAVNGVEGRTVAQIFRYPDDMKFQSSVTLFGAVAGDGAVFRTALKRYFEGRGDPNSLLLLG